MAQRMSLRAYARHRGCTHESVRRAILSGRITQEPDGTVNPAKADREWAENTRPRIDANGAGASHRHARNGHGPVPPGYRTARTVRETYNAKLAGLEYGRRSGELLDAEEVRRAVFARARKVRELLNTVAPRVAPVVAGLDDAGACFKVVQDEINRALAELADPARDPW